MPAYVDMSAREFLSYSDEHILAELHRGYASDRFVTQYTSQTIAWEKSLSHLKDQVAETILHVPEAADWRVLLEFPLYRLRQRIDAVILTDRVVLVLELKVGESVFRPADQRQVEEYALDLRDFHEPSAGVPLIPALWCTAAESNRDYQNVLDRGVSEVQRLGRGDLTRLLLDVDSRSAGWDRVVREDWGSGAYRPVPTVIEAATTLFNGHGVEEIARADASNLRESAERIVSIIASVQERKERALIFLTGVPGSGKTLAGLQVVHRAVEVDVEEKGDITYLSGNTPLVIVLREALARDQYERCKAAGEAIRKDDIRLAVRARIQHIIDFLREYLSGELRAPHEHVIVFDEAQRAWDEKYGAKKFGRTASEPRLLLEIMGRHEDWCALVGLVGGGQEINSGENGIAEWGDALRSLPSSLSAEWKVYGPPNVIDGDNSTAFIGLGEMPSGVMVENDEVLKLQVPLRSFRSPRVSDWVTAVIEGDVASASGLAKEIDEYPIVLTRDLKTAREWLKEMGRGARRYGLVASSGSSRLRAEGLGVSLNATDGSKIAQWYLNPHDDVRSSFALEVTANEYTTQGLELDFIGLCWGGDFLIWERRWKTRLFRGNQWVRAVGDRQRFIQNSYRVLLTRAREGMVLWVPRGSGSDHTREPQPFDDTSEFLLACGVRELVT